MIGYMFKKEFGERYNKEKKKKYFFIDSLIEVVLECIGICCFKRIFLLMIILSVVRI